MVWDKTASGNSEEQHYGNLIPSVPGDIHENKFNKEKIIQILDTAESFLKIGERDVKKVPILRGKTVCNVFFENSTRTRTTFEIAAKRLSADVINLNVATSSQSKGETVLDTINNLIAMNADIFVVRHS